MASKSKYIVFDAPWGTCPVVFAAFMSHHTIANQLNWPVMSAGFCTVEYDEVLDECQYKCWGRSSSLDVPSLPTDGTTLTAYL